MNQLRVGFGVFLGLMLASCMLQSGSLDGNSGEEDCNIAVNSTTTMTIILEYTNDLASKAIYLDTCMVTQVTLQLTASNGSVESTNWSTNSSTEITFQNVSYGSNTLSVLELDCFGGSNAYSSGINVQRGYHYRVTVPIGGSITLNLSTNF